MAYSPASALSQQLGYYGINAASSISPAEVQTLIQSSLAEPTSTDSKYILISGDKPSDAFVALAQEVTVAHANVLRMEAQIETTRALLATIKNRLQTAEQQYMQQTAEMSKYQDVIRAAKEQMRQLLVTEAQILREIENENDINSRCEEPALQETE